MTIIVFYTDNNVKVFESVKEFISNEPEDYIIIDNESEKSFIPRKNVMYIKEEK